VLLQATSQSPDQRLVRAIHNSEFRSYHVAAAQVAHVFDPARWQCRLGGGRPRRHAAARDASPHKSSGELGDPDWLSRQTGKPTPARLA
jgi:hypothetical protein